MVVSLALPMFRAYLSLYCADIAYTFQTNSANGGRDIITSHGPVTIAINE